MAMITRLQKSLLAILWTCSVPASLGAQLRVELIKTIPKTTEEDYYLRPGGVSNNSVGPGFVLKKTYTYEVRCIDSEGRTAGQVEGSPGDRLRLFLPKSAFMPNDSADHFLLVTSEPTTEDPLVAELPKQRHVHIYDGDCKKKWEFDKPPEQNFFLGPKGNSAAGTTDYRMPVLYSEKNRTLVQRDAADAEEPLQGISGLAYSPDGRLIAASVDLFHGQMVMGFGMDGRMRWRTKRFDTSESLAFSPDNAVILAETKRFSDPHFGVTAIDGKTGKILWERRDCEMSSFTPSGREVVLHRWAADRERSEIWIVGLLDGAIHRSLTLPNMIVGDSRFDPTGRKLLLLAYAWGDKMKGDQSEYALLMDLDSANRWQKEFPGSTFDLPLNYQTRNVTQIQFSSDSSRFALIMGNAIEIYAVSM